MLTAAALGFAVSVGTAALKWIYGKFGRVGTQAVVFFFSVLAALYYQFAAQVPGLENLVTTAIVVFGSSVTIYEVILRHIGFFQGPDVG